MERISGWVEKPLLVIVVLLLTVSIVGWFSDTRKVAIQVEKTRIQTERNLQEASRIREEVLRLREDTIKRQDEIISRLEKIHICKEKGTK